MKYMSEFLKFPKINTKRKEKKKEINRHSKIIFPWCHCTPGVCNLIYSFKKEGGGGGGKSRWEDKRDGFMSVFSPFSYFCFFTLDRDGFR